ncbi:conserved hypothetical Ustilaginaceae-specific protein [Sporisorium reilianum SRZ2]|uniref:Conserved hypothetical Ustilaginaceae-specific protein n=1 Tax=Sporisorium reilianum (strain SRZ2) TaxID=999809 RepID=E6ZV00_SPORE|nr:conserved hypothetical Ustilaginaceae-specific protein [Sporisorium reilianum SRZ2]
MKIQTALATVAFTLLSAGIVSAKWLPASAVRSWKEYCTEGGAHVDVAHACFSGPTAGLKRIMMDESNFNGYLDVGPITSNFVVLYQGAGTMIKIGPYKIELSNAANGCVSADIKVKFGAGQGRSLCDEQSWALPDYVWK